MLSGSLCPLPTNNALNPTSCCLVSRRDLDQSPNNEADSSRGRRYGTDQSAVLSCNIPSPTSRARLFSVRTRASEVQASNWNHAALLRVSGDIGPTRCSCTHEPILSMVLLLNDYWAPRSAFVCYLASIRIVKLCHATASGRRKQLFCFQDGRQRPSMEVASRQGSTPPKHC